MTRIIEVKFNYDALSGYSLVGNSVIGKVSKGAVNEVKIRCIVPTSSLTNALSDTARLEFQLPNENLNYQLPSLASAETIFTGLNATESYHDFTLDARLTQAAGNALINLVVTDANNVKKVSDLFQLWVENSTVQIRGVEPEDFEDVKSQVDTLLDSLASKVEEIGNHPITYKSTVYNTLPLLVNACYTDYLADANKMIFIGKTSISVSTESAVVLIKPNNTGIRCFVITSSGTIGCYSATAGETTLQTETTSIEKVSSRTITLNNEDIGTSYAKIAWCNSTFQKVINASNKLSAAYVSGLANVATTGNYNDLINRPSIPTKTSDIVNDSGFATETYVNNKVAGAYVYKGSVPRYDDLPSNVTVSGWIYNVESDGSNYASLYNGGTLTWDKLGGTIDLSGYETKSHLEANYYNKTDADARFTAAANAENKLNKVQKIDDDENHYGSTKAVVDYVKPLKEALGSLYDISLKKGAVTINGLVPSSATIEGETRQLIGGVEAEVVNVYGKSVKWGQLVENGNFADTSGWTTSNCTITASNNIITIVPSQEYSNTYRSTPPAILGHKYLELFEAKSSVNGVNAGNGFGGSFETNVFTLTTEWGLYGRILTCTQQHDNVYIYTSNALGATIQIKNCMLFDLTAIFGSGNEPTTLAEFKALYPNDYYAYDSGSIKSLAYDHIKVSDSNDALIKHILVQDTPITLRGIGDVKDKIVVSKNANGLYTAKVKRYVGEVDLGTINYGKYADGIFYKQITGAKVNGNSINAKYETVLDVGAVINTNNSSCIAGSNDVWMHDNNYTEATAFKTAMNGVKLAYELNSPTEETISTTLTFDEVSAIVMVNGYCVVTDGFLSSSVDMNMTYKYNNAQPKEKAMTLIETITITEDTASISRTFTNHYKKMFIQINTGTTIPTGSVMYVSFDDTFFAITGIQQASAKSQIYIDCSNSLGLIKYQNFEVSTAIGENVRIATSGIVPNTNYFTQMVMNVSGGVLKSGASIQIYGVEE